MDLLKRSLLKSIGTDSKLCYVYDQKPRKVRGIDTAEYFEHLQYLKDQNYTKRCECYCDETFTIGKKVYCLLLVSFGPLMKSKSFQGQNLLAKALGKCLLDQVFVWAEELQVTHNNIIERTKWFIQKKQLRQAKLYISTLRCLFPQSIYTQDLERQLSLMEVEQEKCESSLVCVNQSAESQNDCQGEDNPSLKPYPV